MYLKINGKIKATEQNKPRNKTLYAIEMKLKEIVLTCTHSFNKPTKGWTLKGETRAQLNEC